MPTEDIKPLKLFYCYARADKALRDELDLHLACLKHLDLITSWHDGEIPPGNLWEEEIDKQLKSAHLILLLITPDFIDSDYCYSIEMKHAFEQHQAGTARIIPILLGCTMPEHAPFSTIQPLPADAKEWIDRNKAFMNITRGIHKAIQKLQITLATPQELISKGLALYSLNRYDEAIIAFDHAIQIAPNNSIVYFHQGVVFDALDWYNEAVDAYDQAIQINPNYADAHFNKGNTLRLLERYEEAIPAYDQAILLNPNIADAHFNKGNTLHNLRRYEEAISTYDQAILLNPTVADTYFSKGLALASLNRYEEAISAYDQAILLDPNVAYIQEERPCSC
jgi:tetratricopeptide (TPR) repeat protein